MMDDYRLIQYDEDSNNQLLKDLVRKYIEEHIDNAKLNKEDTIEHLMFEIWQYKLKIYIAYDGGYPIGVIACSTRTFYYHQILRFIFVEKKYQTHKAYENLLDILNEITGYSGLAIISQEPIEKAYLESGFFQTNYINPEHALVFLRKSESDNCLNGDTYLKKHIKYMKKYVSLYSAVFYTSILFGASLFFVILFSFNQSLGFLRRLIPLIVSIILFAFIFAFKNLLNKHNQRGELIFGFQYDMTYINQFQYKFRSKTKVFFISFIQAFMDSGL